MSQLALQSHLVSCPSKGRWLPTAAAVTWVAAPPSEQLAHLWHSWQPGHIVSLPVQTWPSDFHDWWRIRGSLTDSLRNQLALLSKDWQSLSDWSTTAPTLLELTEMGHYSISTTEERTSALRLFSEELLPSLLALGLVERSADGELIRLSDLGNIFLSLAQPLNQTPEAIGSTAGKQMGERTIDPYYLYKRVDIWYRKATCRKAQDNRNFRLDRIRELTIIEPPKPKRR